MYLDSDSARSVISGLKVRNYSLMLHLNKESIMSPMKRAAK
jgi:hypothetical protein